MNVDNIINRLGDIRTGVFRHDDRATILEATEVLRGMSHVVIQQQAEIERLKQALKTEVECRVNNEKTERLDECRQLLEHICAGYSRADISHEQFRVEIATHSFELIDDVCKTLGVERQAVSPKEEFLAATGEGAE